MVRWHARAALRLRATTVLIKALFAAALHVVLVCFYNDEAVVGDLVQLNDTGLVGTEEEVSLVCVRKAGWGMSYADDAGTVSKRAKELPKITTVIAAVFEAAGLTV